MHFYNLINELCKDKESILFVDMDGVIASYEYGKPLDFANKRPLVSNIRTLEKIASLNNLELHILSICREDFQIEEKKQWLKENAPFFKEENVHILSKHGNKDESSSEMKMVFIKDFNTDRQIILVDDDIRVLKKIDSNVDNIILFQDSELVD